MTEAVGAFPSAAYLGGAWIGARDGSTFGVVDPASGDELARVPALGPDDATAAVDAAAAALPGWRGASAGDRSAVLRRWSALMLQRADDLATLVTLESGKPLAEAHSEVRYAADFLDWFAEEGRRAYGRVIPPPHASRRLFALRRPIGVGAAITPWNFPLAMVTRKCGPAFAVGCTIVLKPAEQTPLSALALAALAAEAGLPAGVLNVVTADAAGTPAIGDILTGNPMVRTLSFTGSTAVGKYLFARCAATVKRVSLELGGNAPFVVFADADLDAAVDGLIASKFRNAGQTCVCANRILVQSEVLDDVAERLVDRVGLLRVGPGLAEGTQVGPLIDAAAVAKVTRHVEDARAGGATLLIGGGSHPFGGSFFEPTVLTGVRQDALMTREETFGPVCGLIPFGTEDEAVRLANEGPAGLAAYVYTQDDSRLWRLADTLDVGALGANTGVISTPVAPLGGVKESGLGREGGTEGLDDWLETTYLCLEL